MGMREELETIMGEIEVARSEPLADHPTAVRIRNEWPAAVTPVVDDESYKIEGSPGKGNWAQSVWLSVFDRTVTETARKGFYVVYLVAPDGSKTYLSLNQATTEIQNRVGGGRYLDVLRDTAERDVGLLAKEETGELLTGPLELDAGTTMARGYEAGNILAIEYQQGSVPEDGVLADDLTRMLLLYQSLVEARDQVQADAGGDDTSHDSEDDVEAKRYRWHRRAERSRSLATKAKEIHGAQCQVPACGKRLNSLYGGVGEGYIEAHHLTPFADLKGRPTKLNPKTDFAVVCPDCHRMIHRRKEPYSLLEVSSMIVETQKQ